MIFYFFNFNFNCQTGVTLKLETGKVMSMCVMRICVMCAPLLLTAEMFMKIKWDGVVFSENTKF